VNGGFICSDSPLVWGNLSRLVEGDTTQSLMDDDVEITLPVTRNVALVSYPGARDGNLTATDEIVGHINMRTLQVSTGLIFHCHSDFLLKRESGDMRHGSEYFAYVREARARGVARP